MDETTNKFLIVAFFICIFFFIIGMIVEDKNETYIAKIAIEKGLHQKVIVNKNRSMEVIWTNE